MEGSVKMLDKYIVFLTFIPWILFFIVSIIRNLNNNNYRKFSFSYLRKNLFKIFRLDLLFLVGVYIYFASYKMEFVDKYLFLVMNLYLFVNSFYDKKSKISKNFYKKNIIELILLVLIMLIPFIIYIVKDNLVLTYKIMLLYLVFEYVIILLVSYLGRLLKGKKES